MGKHGKQLSKAASKLKAKAKVAKKSKTLTTHPSAPEPKPVKVAKAPKKALKDMDVDEFLAGGHLADPAPAPEPAAAEEESSDESSMAADHQAELDGLKETDPDFYQCAPAFPLGARRGETSPSFGRNRSRQTHGAWHRLMLDLVSPSTRHTTTGT